MLKKYYFSRFFWAPITATVKQYQNMSGFAAGDCLSGVGGWHTCEKRGDRQKRGDNLKRGDKEP